MTKIKTGQVLNPNGRPKGTKNKRTIAWDKLSNDLINKHSTRFNRNLSNMSDEDFNDMYLRIIKYVKPTITQSTITGDISINKDIVKNIFPTPDEQDETKG